jgi:hypothetical protein
MATIIVDDFEDKLNKLIMNRRKIHSEQRLEERCGTEEVTPKEISKLIKRAIVGRKNRTQYVGIDSEEVSVWLVWVQYFDAYLLVFANIDNQIVRTIFSNKKTIRKWLRKNF